MTLKFRQMPGPFVVCRLAPDAEVPSWVPRGSLVSITRTHDELSIVCSDAVGTRPNLLPLEKYEPGWACLKLEGPFPFSMTGVLSSFLAPLAKHKVPIFAVSTFDTDYVLIKNEYLADGLTALQAAGHELVG
jgi:uncharacterized protein